jgi:cation:H+ antiporter
MLAGVGGVLFVRGVLGFARWARIPAAIAAATLGAFATSSPEVFVSTIAALDGKPAIGLGDATGSNVVNGLFIVGIAAVITPIRIQGSGLWIALGAALYAVVLAWPGASERLGRNRGVALIAGYAAYLSLLAVSARH